MNLDNFRTLLRAYVPGAKISVINNTILNLLINKGCDDVNSFGRLMPTDKQFDVEAEKMDYNILTDVADDFSSMDKPGIWWNAGTTAVPNWIQLNPVTEKWLDRFHTNWREESSSDPKYYVYKDGEIKIFPKGDTALTNGLWIYYIKTADYMTLGTHYPFTGSTSELTHLRDMDDPIIDYVRWKLSRPLGKTAVGVLTKQEYEAVRLEKLGLINTRVDISAHRDARMRGPAIR